MPQQAPKAEETVEIVKLGHAGDGVTEDGLFVPYTLPGDVVRIAREGARARLRNVITPGAWRVPPPCPHFGRCGGCALQHVAREPYLQWKRDLVVTALKQRAFSDVAVEDIHAVSPGTRRRANFKAQASRAGVLVGFYEAASRNLIDLSECPILVPQLARLMAPLRTHLAGLMRPNETAELLATLTDSGIDLALKLKRRRAADLLTALSELALSLKLARLSWNGEDVAMAAAPVIKIGRFQVTLPPDAFLQPTKEGERSAAKARRVADLFSGCGTFALALAGEHAVHAVDSVAPQIEALSAAAKQGQAKLSSEVRDLFRRPLLAAELSRFDAVVLDPPRPGAAEQARALAQSEVARILYVSCNAASFARDARILADGGYRLECVRPLDQFLWSPHVELFAEFSR
jgi:23S rRNA (uracil1939-C5)-methyltransferase